MIVLGIDPGMADTGYGVVAVDGSRLRPLDHGVLRTSAGDPAEQRLAGLQTSVTELLDEHSPQAVALEDLFVGANPRTILSVGQARGAILAACGAAGVPVSGYAPAEIKLAVCGYGRADKAQVVADGDRHPGHRRGRPGQPRRRRPGGGRLPRPDVAHRASASGGRPVIASLRGRVAKVGPGSVVLEVGGVGYGLAATASACRLASDAEAEITLVTHLHVREDALQLFGFAAAGERELFELLLGVSGVGPKAALAIVSGYAPDQIRRAVASADHALFMSIPGIGRRTAERVVIDLKDKVGSPLAEANRGGPPVDDHTAAREALVGLGMSVAEAESALREVDDELPVGERVRAALAGRAG